MEIYLCVYIQSYFYALIISSFLILSILTSTSRSNLIISHNYIQI